MVAMSRLPLVIVFLVLVVLMVVYVSKSLSEGASGLKAMLFGLNLTIMGGIVAVDPNSNLGGFEYLIVLLGFIISFIGLKKKD
jgi:phosphotransferase system  glucose/maltose/N-acetylglucosamine-specific IIC component